MGLADLAKRSFGGRPAIPAERLRKAKPLRNPLVTWESLEDGTAALDAPLAQQGRGFMALLAKWMKAPTTKKFELEPVGAFVWTLCDGAHTFDAISRRLRERYKMNRLEADAALSAFLQMLSQRRLVSLTAGTEK